MKEEKESPSMVVVMGVTGAGKSYYINKLAGKEVVKEGPDLESCKLGSLVFEIKKNLNFTRYARMSVDTGRDWREQGALNRHTGLR